MGVHAILFFFYQPRLKLCISAIFVSSIFIFMHLRERDGDVKQILEAYNFYRSRYMYAADSFYQRTVKLITLGPRFKSDQMLTQ